MEISIFSTNLKIVIGYNGYASFVLRFVLSSCKDDSYIGETMYRRKSRVFTNDLLLFRITSCCLKNLPFVVFCLLIHFLLAYHL